MQSDDDQRRVHLRGHTQDSRRDVDIAHLLMNLTVYASVLDALPHGVEVLILCGG
jgi:hypothetical protein